MKIWLKKKKKKYKASAKRQTFNNHSKVFTKAIYAPHIYILSVYAFTENRTHDLSVAIVPFYTV